MMCIMEESDLSQTGRGAMAYWEALIKAGIMGEDITAYGAYKRYLKVVFPMYGKRNGKRLARRKYNDYIICLREAKDGYAKGEYPYV